ncbi:50S ribosomal protein L3 [Francisella philomiragia]|uniref:Large ribosomal subunit protein uL3 n=2 Tax=Francisella philomiragia TaxID=28110 RepID=RL3_FRAP2|nr:50S ribosomal protein L3 [Francisella philomiragia]B0U0Y9.1 RecName: Full=Large ribosomal subunit protein uL3; AltName: Full=50S ribosomal protein L3 [Francisella philomiragia subsp. philomiragia ATCC 25017]AJI46338.1 50S ribosomal protein L3 [Francisella philomiragia]AJI49281.1 50S ribosomal protein L3 [Francisella philomiragia]AJI56681.1 50S ribosomal protein L3 [Francisella philomiragia]AJI75348.1 50S ribosomal protein L3 [Francisella philomiragia subsp. philomiragia ATCC 25015]EET20371
MSLGLVGRKCGMTRIFTEDGVSIPVTVVQVESNKVTQIKTTETDGYNAIQVTTGFKKRSNVNKPMAGHYAKASVEPGRGLWEFAIDNASDYEVGASIDATIFEAGQKVDVRGVSKGKGFQGGVKRHNFATQDATHGNSLSHRVHGSTGQNQTPGRVFKNKKMAGHLGSENVTIQSLEVVRVDAENGLLLLKGGIPGSVGGDVIVTPAVKS